MLVVVLEYLPNADDIGCKFTLVRLRILPGGEDTAQPRRSVRRHGCSIHYFETMYDVEIYWTKIHKFNVTVKPNNK